MKEIDILINSKTFLLPLLGNSALCQSQLSVNRLGFSGQIRKFNSERNIVSLVAAPVGAESTPRRKCLRFNAKQLRHLSGTGKKFCSTR